FEQLASFFEIAKCFCRHRQSQQSHRHGWMIRPKGPLLPTERFDPSTLRCCDITLEKQDVPTEDQRLCHVWVTWCEALTNVRTLVEDSRCRYVIAGVPAEPRQ